MLGVPFVFGMETQKCTKYEFSPLHAQNSQKGFIKNCRQLLVLSRIYPQNQTRKFVFPVLIRRDFHNIRIKAWFVQRHTSALYKNKCIISVRNCLKMAIILRICCVFTLQPSEVFFSSKVKNLKNFYEWCRESMFKYSVKVIFLCARKVKSFYPIHLPNIFTHKCKFFLQA